METIATRTLSSGKTLTLTARDSIGYASVDGKLIESGAPYVCRHATLPAPYTHLVRERVPITAAEAAAIDATAKPRPQADTLRDERRALVAALRSARDEQADIRTRAIEHGSMGGSPMAMLAKADAMDAPIAAQAAAVDAFDVAHPEVIAAIRAEKARALADFQASN
jgi:hypothetical protein